MEEKKDEKVVKNNDKQEEN